MTIKGILPAEWRRPGNWISTPDLNSDELPDFLETKRTEHSPINLMAHSGGDGRHLWQTEIRTTNIAGPDQVLALDLNADGVSDLIFFESGEKNPGTTQTVAAISGKDG